MKKTVRSKLWPVILFWLPLTSLAQNNTSPGLQVFDNFPEPNGPVRLMIKDTASNTLYVTGDFTAVGGNSHSQGAFIDNSTGVPKSNFPKIEGTVNASIPDGKGGWFIGGDFTRVGDKERIDLAQVDSSGNVTDFFDGMKTDGEIKALCKNNNSLYIGGKFGTVGRSMSKYADVLNAYSGGSVLNLEGFNGPIYCASSDIAGGWYVGGFFTRAGGKPRTHLAHILADGSIGDWAPFVNDTVYAILYDGYYTVWAGGALNYYYNKSIVTLSYAQPDHLVAISKSSGEVWPSGYKVNGTVRCLFLAPDLPIKGRYREIFVGGSFYAQFPNGTVSHHLFSFGKQSYNGQGSFIKNYYQVYDFNIPPYATDKGIFAVYIHPSQPELVFIGGNFTVNNGLRKNLLLVDRSGLAQSNWIPNPNGPVHSISSYYKADLVFPVFLPNVYFGGAFTALGGQTNSTYTTAISRNRLFAVNANTLALDSAWTPDANGTVRSMSFMQDNQGQFSAFFGGDFTEVNNIVRNHLAKVDTYGNLISFNPGPDSTVYVVVQAKDHVFIGGLFSHLSSSSKLRRNLASVELNCGQITTWNPGTSTGTDIQNYWAGYSYPIMFRQFIRGYKHYVSGLCISGNSVYANGFFDTAGGNNRKNLVKINAGNGQADAWNPSPDGSVSNLLLAGNKLYVSGGFSTIGASSRKGIAAIDTAAGTISTWYPGNGNIDFKNGITSMTAYSNKIIMGGSFTIDPTLKSLVAADITSGLLSNPLSGIQTSPSSIAVSGNNLYLAGTIIRNDDSSGAKNGIARFDLETGSMDNWFTICNGHVTTLTPVGNTTFAGGFFSSMGGTQRRHALAIHSATGDLLPWNPSPDTPPLSMLSHNGLIYAGGNFKAIGGKSRHGIAALDPVTGMATNWNPGDSGTISVNGLEAFGDTLFAGGEFTSIGGSSRQNLAGLALSTGIASPWNPQPNHVVSSLAKMNNLLYAGGMFEFISGSQRYGFAAFNLQDNSLNPWVYVAGFDAPPAYEGFKKVRKISGDCIAAIRNFPNRIIYQNQSNIVEVTGSSEYWLLLCPIPGREYSYHMINDMAAYSSQISIGGVKSDQKTSYSNAGNDPLGINSINNFNLISLGIDQTNDANKSVNSILYSGDTLFTGGEFDRIGGIEKAFLAALKYYNDSCASRPAAPTINAYETYCHGDSVELRPTPYLGIYSYEWTGPNGFYSTAAKPKIYNFNESNAGLYTCRMKVFSSNCWSKANSITVPILGVPVEASLNSPCPGDSLQLSSSFHPATYSWSGPNGFTSAQQNNVISNIQLADSGNYIVTTTETGCPAHSDTVRLSFGPTSILSQPMSRRACSGENAYFSVLASGNALSYQWQIYNNGWNNLTDDNFYQGSQSSTLSVLSDTAYLCRSFRCLISSGCYPSVYSDSVTLKNGLVYPGITADSSACTPSVQITSLSSLSPCKKDSLTIAYVYNGGIDCGTDSLFVQLSDSAGSFASPLVLGAQAFDLSGSVKVLIPCTLPNGTAYRIRIVLSPPWIYGPDNGSSIAITECLPSPLSISSNSPVCQGGTLQLFSSPQYNYNWTKGGFIFSTQQNPVIFPANPGNSGYYTLSVDWACGTKKDSLRVDIVPKPTLYVPFPPLSTGGRPVRFFASGLNPVATNNQVWVGQAKASISFIDTNRLDIIAPVNGTYGPVTITDLQCGLSSQSIEPLFITDACPKPLSSISTFAPAVSFSLGAASANVHSALGDIDGDRKLDIIVRNGTAGTLQVMRNVSVPGIINPSAFLPPVNFTPPSAIQGNEEIIVHDFDNDGKQDVLCNSSAYPFFWLWRNTSSLGTINASSLAAPITFGTGIGGAKGLAIADFNLDGKTDIAAGDSLFNIIWIYRNHSVPGSLSPQALPNPTFINSSASRPTKALAAADLNGDQYPDLVQLCSNGKISIYLGGSGFGFSTPIDFTTQANATCLAIADLDKDYKSDIVIGYGPGANGLSYWRNTSTFGSFSLATRTDLSTSVPTVRITTADINGDGKVDLVTANNNNANTGNTFTAWPNNSTAPFITFSPVVNFTTATGPHMIQVADFDSSGSKDVLITYSANTSVHVLRNLTTPTNVPTVTASGPTSFCTGGSVTLTCNFAASYNWSNGATTSSITVSSAGNYWVVANGCERSDTIPVAVKSFPSAYNVSGGGVYCNGGSPVNINLAGSQSGITYHLLRNSAPTGDSLAGTGAALNFPGITQGGAYTISANTDSSACSTTMSGSALCTQQSIPLVFNVTGGGSYCIPSQAVLEIRLSGSEAGVNYQLVRNDTLTGTALPGTGASLSFSNQATEGIYKISASANGCSALMHDSTFIAGFNDPDSYTVTGGGNYCSSPGAGVSIQLSNSEPGVRYLLYRYVDPVINSEQYGNNSALQYAGITDTGLYSILGINNASGCQAFMNDSVTVSLTESTRFYRDYDNDGFGDADNYVDSCVAVIPGYLTTGGDCDDSTLAVNAAATEICLNNIDDNCSGTIDEFCYNYIALRVLIEGFYLGNGSMIAVADPVNMPGICDTITLSIADSATLTILYTDTAVIDTSGFGFFRIPNTPANTSYYLVVKHRNSIETWSKTPFVPGQLGFFDFTASSSVLNLSGSGNLNRRSKLKINERK